MVLHTCVRVCPSVASMSVAADRRFATPSTITPGKTNVAKRAHSAALRLPAILITNGPGLCRYPSDGCEDGYFFPSKGCPRSSKCW